MLLVSVNDLALPDRATPSTTFYGEIEKLNVTSRGADTRVEIRERSGFWNPAGLRVGKDEFRSVTGWKASAVRFSNWTPGAIATVSFEAYSTDE